MFNHRALIILERGKLGMRVSVKKESVDILYKKCYHFV